MDVSDRLLTIVIELQEKGWQRAADLAATLNVSQSTVYRDVEVLVEAGVPVVGVPGKGYRLSETYFLPSLPLTTDEAVLLRLSIDDVDRRLGTNYQAAAAAIRKKLDGLLPDRLRGEAASLQQRLRFEPVNAFDDPARQEVLRLLQEAWSMQRVVRFQETGRSGGDGAVAARTVHPYGLLHLSGVWHLVGYSEDTERVRSFRLDRMQGLEMTDRTFERPASYAEAAGPGDAARDISVRVLFDADVARWVRHAPSAYVVDLTDTPDGLLVTLHVRRETEVLPWLLSWGGHARVLEPVSLQRRLAREARRIASHYQPAPTFLG